MQAVILIGGLGTRLRPLTYTIPKGLVEVAGRPFLEYELLYLKKFGVERVLFLTGYLGEQVEERFPDGSIPGLEFTYSREEKPRGTGGALKLALPLLEDEFLLLNGDTLLPADYGKLRDSFSDFPGLALLSAFPVAGSGIVPNLLLGEGEKIAAYGPAGGTHVDAGVGIFRKKIAGYFPAGEKFSLEEEVCPELIRKGLLGYFPVKEYYYDIGTPARLRKFEGFIAATGKKLFNK